MKRCVVKGSKHNTATYILEIELEEKGRHYLDFIDLALHIALKANDNKHRNDYPREKMAEFLAECVEKGYNHSEIIYYEDMDKLWKDLEKTFKRFYRKIWKKKKQIDIVCELPRRSDETNPPLTVFSDFSPPGVSVPLSDEQYEELTR